eukprot:408528-Rhodomonas_salina.1
MDSSFELGKMDTFRNPRTSFWCPACQEKWVLQDGAQAIPLNPSLRLLAGAGSVNPKRCLNAQFKYATVFLRRHADRAIASGAKAILFRTCLVLPHTARWLDGHSRRKTAASLPESDEHQTSRKQGIMKKGIGGGKGGASRSPSVHRSASRGGAGKGEASKEGGRREEEGRARLPALTGRPPQCAHACGRKCAVLTRHLRYAKDCTVTARLAQPYD